MDELNIEQDRGGLSRLRRSGGEWPTHKAKARTAKRRRARVMRRATREREAGIR